MPKTIVAMSGGLDSAVTAALLLEQGHDIAGLTMRIWHEDGSIALDNEVASASRLCHDLGIDHYVVDLGHAFCEQVVAPFVRDYASGRTPNPCVRCNPAIKFGLLWEHARSLGADAMATGHYARIERGPSGWTLARGIDSAKDQSYFLYRLGQAELAHTLFPLSGWTKDQARDYARRRGLSVAERPESQDICFLRDGDYRRFVRDRAPEAFTPGPIFDQQGKLLGEHQGLAAYTLGQRRGLGIAAERPLYVLRLDFACNTLIVGYREALGCDTLETEDTVWVSGQAPTVSIDVQVQIRYRSKPVAASVEPMPSGHARVILSQSVRDAMPGQSAVFYGGDDINVDRVLGGGIIARAYNSH